jgi:hypothetical protein
LRYQTAVGLVFFVTPNSPECKSQEYQHFCGKLENGVGVCKKISKKIIKNQQKIAFKQVTPIGEQNQNISEYI